MPQPIVDPSTYDPNSLPVDQGSEPPNPPIVATGVSTPVPPDMQGTPLSPNQFLQSQAETAQKTADIAESMGEEQARTGQEQADIQKQGLQESNQLRNDTAAHYQQLQNMDSNWDNQASKAYQDAKASQIDPNHWWNSKSTGGKIEGIIGIMLGGLAQGAQMWGGNKQATNPAIDAMNDAIKEDIESQKTNMDQKWQAYREAHSMADTILNKQHFLDQHFQSQYMMGQQVVADRLKQAAAESGSNMAKLNADKAVTDIEAELNKERGAVGARLASAGAAASAAQREHNKMVAEAYRSFVEKHNDLGDDEARAAAAKDLAGMPGVTPADINPMMAHLGASFNPQTGNYDFPKETPKSTNDLIPDVDPATGKRLKPEEREKLQQLTVSLPPEVAAQVGRSTALANNQQDQEHIMRATNAGVKVKQFHDLLSSQVDAKGHTVPGLLEKYKAGTLTAEDIGQWKTARQAAIDSFKAAATGAEGMTGKGMATMLGEEAFPEPPSLAGAKVNKLIPNALQVTPNEIGGQLKQLDQFTKENNQGIIARLRPMPTAQPANTNAIKIDFTPKVQVR